MKANRVNTLRILIGSISKEVVQASSTIKFGKKKGGVALGFRGTDPLKAGLDYAILTASFAKCATPIATHFHGDGYK
jgi:hypothetical protein